MPRVSSIGRCAENLIAKGTRRAPGIVLGSLVLATCLVSPALSARSTPEGCTKTRGSSLVINVKDQGAKGDSRTNDSAAIQAVIDEIAGTGGTAFVPDGTYMIDAVEARLTLKSNMTLNLSRGATLKAIPNNSEHYSVLSISGVSNVIVAGGTLEGDREEHKSESGEWGMGISINGGAEHITVNGVIAKNMWGDGFYVEGAKDVKFCSATADNNRRQGLSVIEADGVLITKSVFSNTWGTRPSAGIDLEPDEDAQKITNVRIQNSKFYDNAGAGILIAGKRGEITKIAIAHNVFRGGRAILIENAPTIGSAICDNRYIAQQATSPDSLNAFADPAEGVFLQNRLWGCFLCCEPAEQAT